MSNPTVIVEKIQIRRGRQIELPGKPVTLEPLLLSESLDEGEFGMAVDTGRLFIGHNPRNGDVNFQRGTFPYRNLEVLTENSPRTRELFSHFLRDQGKDTFFIPTEIVPTGGEFEDFDHSELDEHHLIPTQLNVEYGVAVFEIAAFVNGGPRDGWAVYNSRIRFIIGSTNDARNVEIVRDPNILPNDQSLDFRIVESDPNNNIWSLQYSNSTTENLNVYIRRIVINTPQRSLNEEEDYIG